MADYRPIDEARLAPARSISGEVLTRDQLIARAALCDEFGPVAVGRALGVDHATVSRQRARAARQGLLPEVPAGVSVPPGFEIRRRSAQIRKGAVVGETVEIGPERGDPFAVPAGHFVSGESALVDAEGRVVTKWVKTRQGADAAAARLDAIEARFQSIPAAPIVPPPEVVPSADLLHVLPVADAHFGQYSWAAEAGENYSLEIAQRVFRAVHAPLIVEARPAAEFLFLGLGDLVHMNDDEARTKKSGNSLDVDGRIDKVVDVLILCLVWAIGLAAARHGLVRVVLVKGNHDEDVTVALRAALYWHFRDDPRIVVEPSASKIWFGEWGAIDLVAFHGHTFKPERVFALAADRDRRQARTPGRWLRAYHGHEQPSRRIVNSDGTAICEMLEPMTAPDAYHAAGGYRSDRSGRLITHRKSQPDHTRRTISILPDETDNQEVIK